MSKPVGIVLLILVFFGAGIYVGYKHGVPSEEDFAKHCKEHCPWVPVGPDPPVIVSGGSIHASLVGATYASPVVTVPNAVLNTVSFAGYYSSGTLLPTVLLTTNWEIDVCDSVDLHSACVAHGVRICSSLADPATGNCTLDGTNLPTAKGSLYLSSLDSTGSDQFQRVKDMEQYSDQRKFKLMDKHLNGEAYHAAYVQIKQGNGGTTTQTISCGNTIPPPSSTDWTACYVRLGSQ